MTDEDYARVIETVALAWRESRELGCFDVGAAALDMDAEALRRAVCDSGGRALERKRGLFLIAISRGEEWARDLDSVSRILWRSYFRMDMTDVATVAALFGRSSADVTSDILAYVSKRALD